MAIRAFPPVDLADEYGLLAVGGDLEVSSLLLAYRNGIFPWPLQGEDRITWFAPPERAILKVSEFKASRSLKRSLKRHDFHFKFNSNFSAVTAGCSEKRKSGTWLNIDMREAYLELYRQGYAHSLECYLKEELVGGLYGVTIGKLFTGESMFHRIPDASKLVLWVLSEYLHAEGAPWIDCQVMNPHLESLGVVEISRTEFMSNIARLTTKESITYSNERLHSLVETLRREK